MLERELTIVNKLGLHARAAAEVAQWRDILAARGGKFTRLAQICQTWLDEECA